MGTRRAIELSEQLIYWTEPHPSWQPNAEWPEEVGSVLYKDSGALALIDPLIRDDLDPRAWTWLDEAVAAERSPVIVLLTAPWHERSTRDVLDRYNARVWTAPSARGRIHDLPQLDAIPPAIRVLAPRGVDEGQVAFLLEAEQTLVVAEFFLGTAGGLQVLPSPATRDLREFVESLQDLERLRIERVLVAHGPPVLNGGSGAIAAALRTFGTN